MRRRTGTVLAGLVLAIVCIAGVGRAERLTLDRWMVTGAVTVPYAMLDEDLESDPAAVLLDAPPVDPYDAWFREGDEVTFAPGAKSAFAEGPLDFAPPAAGSGELRVAYAAAYLNVPAWQEATLEVAGNAPFRLFLDGEEALVRTAAADSDSAATGPVTLDQGLRRLLLVTAARGADSLDAWRFEITLDRGDEAEPALAPEATLDPVHPFEITDYYLQESVGSFDLTEDGRWLAAVLRRLDRRKDKTVARLEVWDLKSRRKAWNYFAPQGISAASWAPDGLRLLIVVPGSDGHDVLLWHRDTGMLETVMRNRDDNGDYLWGPDGEVLYYTKTEPYEEQEDQEYKVMWGLEDRWKESVRYGDLRWRNDSEVYFHALDGAEGKLTEGRYNPESFLISPDGGKLVLTRTVPVPRRPFLLPEIWTVSTSTGEAKRVYDGGLGRVQNLTFSPDGGRLAFAAPADPVVPREGLDNIYPDHNAAELDLWILDLATGEAENRTRDFAPAVVGSYYGTGRGGLLLWREDGRIAFTAAYGKHIRFYLYDPDAGAGFEEIDLPTPGASMVAASRRGTRLVYQADRLNDFPRVYQFDWKRRRGGELFAHNETLRRLTTLPRTVQYDYVNEDGTTIPGYLVYPAGYDSTKSYPMIVDFYGGVIGYGDGFRWGEQVYADRGYFVYVPVPRGASGYGQEFADDHNNDWGRKAGVDMNRGVKHVIAHVPGVDGARVAPTSGSYGGFMTMYLLSMPKDDPDCFDYATGISGYGISDIASYWGAGWWGFLYSDYAAAPGSFPWNNRELYVGQSPLYRADNITAPLLMFHGEEDINVPIVESDQMYTALKVLGREVEFIRWPNEGHNIYSKRAKYLLTKRMNLEWMDKHLRGLPGAWDKRMEKEHKK